MARYTVTEHPDGDLVIHFPEGDKRITARRERANQMPAIAIEAARYSNHWQPDMVQVSFVIYRREDGVEINGHYEGKCLELQEP